MSTEPLRFGAAEPIDADSGFTDVAVAYGYDVAADGSVLVVRAPAFTPEAASLRVALDWATDLGKRVAIG
jgi:hypothetical protein